MVRLLLFFSVILLFSCQNKKESIEARKQKSKTTKESSNPIEALILKNEVENVFISQPLGKNIVTSAFNTKDNKFLFSESIMIIDSLRFNLDDILKFEIIPDNHLYIESQDRGVYYVRDMTQEKLEHLESSRVSTYRYENILLINHPLLNHKAPQINGQTMAGQNFNLNKKIGKIVHLNFWFLGCIPCLKQKKEINTLVQDFPNVEFISVAKDSLKHLSRFIDHIESTKFNVKTPYNYFDDQILFDIIPDGQKVIDEYSFIGYPISFVINENGIIVAVTRYSEKYGKNMSKLLSEVQENI